MFAGCDQSPIVSIARALPLEDAPAREASNEQWLGPTGISSQHSRATLDGSPKAPCPEEMALVGTTCMDRFEAHLVSAAPPNRVHSPFETPLPGERYVAKSARGTIPQAYISREDSAAACQQAGKRLCTGREWQKACRGSANSTYPYGPEEVRGRCNTRKPHLPSVLFGKDSTPENAREYYNSPLLNQQPGYLAATGAYSECVSDTGVFDLEGNLHEWVADRPEGSPVSGPRSRAVFMGGFFSSTSDHGPGCQHVSRRHSPVYHDYSTGFRCCKERSE